MVQYDPPLLAGSPRYSYDHIVIGGGSAGCVVAGQLSAAGRRVLLLEAGRTDDSIFIRWPAGSFKIVFGGMDYYHGWQSDRGINGDVFPVQLHRANVLGGGSSINVGAYTRGNPRDYGRWAEATGDEGWSWDSMLSCFTAQEGNQRLSDSAHGTDGALKVSDPRYISPIAKRFVEAMVQRGTALNDDFNDGDQNGVGYFQTTHFRGRRCSAADAFLRPQLGNPDLTLLTGAKVEHLIIENGRVCGVRFVHDGTIREARVDGDVVLTAGAYITPQILMRSGIGPADHLRECGIDVVLDQPRIGQNLMDHPMVGVTVFTKPDLGYFKQERGWRLARNMAQYLLARKGPIASNGSEACAFVNPTHPETDPTHQIYCLGVMWPDSYRPVTPSHGLTLHSGLLQPRARGSISLDRANPGGEIKVRTGFLTDAADLSDMIAGVEILFDLLRTGPLAQAVTSLASPGQLTMSRRELEAFCRQVVVSNAHGSGTCAMGKRADSALDPAMRLNGLTGLRVMDASAFPAIPSANINAAVMAAARRGANFLLNEN